MLPKLAVIGAGTMGEAIIKGLLRENLIAPEDITAADPWVERLDYLKEQYGSTSRAITLPPPGRRASSCFR